METTVMTTPQLRNAWLLGCHFKHHWASAFAEVPQSLEVIKATSRGRAVLGVARGQLFPTLNEEGEVVFQEGSLGCSLRKDGIIRFAIVENRTHLLTVTFNGNNIVSLHRSGEGRIEPKHIEALQNAMAVLLVRYIPQVRKTVAREEISKVIRILTKSEANEVLGHYAGQRASFLCGEFATPEQKSHVYSLASKMAVENATRSQKVNA